VVDVTTTQPNPTGGGPHVRLGLTQRKVSAAAKNEAVQAMSRFVRLEYWNGMAVGDVVRVAGHSSRGRHWRFRAHVTNTSNGAAWVEVALAEGPPPSRRPAPGAEVEAPRVEKVRSFEPGLVTPRWRYGHGLRRASKNTPEAPPAAPPLVVSKQPSLF
jgi:hypothetical protein